MNKKDIFLFSGIVVGIVGAAVGIAAIIKKRKHDIEREDLEKHLSFSFPIPKSEPVVMPVLPKVSKSKPSSLAQQKQDKAHSLLKLMKSGKSYTQVELQELSNIPYRSVRRYIDILVKNQKITAVGYGKGRKFSK